MSRKRWQFLFALLCALLYLFAGVAFGDTLTVDGEDIEVWKVSDDFYQDAATYAASTNFYITGKKGLIYFRDFVNGGDEVAQYIADGFYNSTAVGLFQTNIFTDKTVHLLADVDLENVEWKPIGSVGASPYNYKNPHFFGSFDGHGHTISNLNAVPNGDRDFDEVGLFGRTQGNGSFSNITLHNVTATGIRVGALLGFTVSTKTNTFTNCHVTGTININGEGGATKGGGTGGLVGYGYNLIFDNCTIDGSGTIAGTTSAGKYSCPAGFFVGAGIYFSKFKSNCAVSGVTASYRGVETETFNGWAEAQIKDEEYTTMYGDIERAVNAASTDQTVEIIVPYDSYSLPTVPTRVTIEGKVDGVTFSHTGGGDIASVANGVTFRNVSFDFGNNDYHGFWNSDNLTFENCNLIGKLFSYHSLKFNDCKFINNSGDYNMWCYGGNNATSLVEYHNCDFTSSKGKFLNIYSESAGPTYHHNVIVDGCSFTNTNEAASKAALNITETVGTAPLAYDV